MSDAFPTVAELVLSGSGSDGLKAAARGSACFSAWSVADVAGEIHHRHGGYFTFPVDPDLRDELVALVEAADDADRVRRLPVGTLDFKGRLAAMTLADLFDPSQDRRLGDRDPVDGSYDLPVVTSVRRILRGRPDAGSVTLLEFHERMEETTERLSSTPRLGKGAMAEIRRRALLWISRVERDPEPPRPPGGFFDAWREETIAASSLCAFDLALRFVGPRHARVLTLRYGLDGSGCRTSAQVAAEFGVTRSRAGILGNEALRRLGHPIPRHLLRRHLADRPAGVEYDGRDRLASEVVDDRDATGRSGAGRPDDRLASVPDDL